MLYCPFLCCHSFLWKYVVLLSGSESVAFYRFVIYVLPLEIQLLRMGDCDPTNRFNPATFVCLSQVSYPNVIFCGLFYLQWVQSRWEVILRFVEVGGIDDQHCLNFLFITNENIFTPCLSVGWVLKFADCVSLTQLWFTSRYERQEFRVVDCLWTYLFLISMLVTV